MGAFPEWTAKECGLVSLLLKGIYPSIVPRPSLAPVFDRLHFVINTCNFTPLVVDHQNKSLAIGFVSKTGPRGHRKPFYRPEYGQRARGLRLRCVNTPSRIPAQGA